MGVPVPHIALSLSGCLSKRNPARAARGEARGHRSVLAQKPLLMYRLLFLVLEVTSVWCVSPDRGLSPMCLRCCGYIPVEFRSMALRCGHAGHRRAHNTMTVALCVVCASPRGVCVHRRRACPHRNDVGPWCTAGANCVATALGTMVLRGCVCVCGNRGRRTHNGYPEDRGGLWVRVRFGRSSCICVSLR